MVPVLCRPVPRGGPLVPRPPLGIGRRHGVPATLLPGAAPGGAPRLPSACSWLSRSPSWRLSASASLPLQCSCSRSRPSDCWLCCCLACGGARAAPCEQRAQQADGAALRRQHEQSLPQEPPDGACPGRRPAGLAACALHPEACSPQSQQPVPCQAGSLCPAKLAAAAHLGLCCLPPFGGQRRFQVCQLGHERADFAVAFVHLRGAGREEESGPVGMRLLPG